jgi:hypothetical protein
MKLDGFQRSTIEIDVQNAKVEKRECSPTQVYVVRKDEALSEEVEAYLSFPTRWEHLSTQHSCVKEGSEGQNVPCKSTVKLFEYENNMFNIKQRYSTVRFHLRPWRSATSTVMWGRSALE